MRLYKKFEGNNIYSSIYSYNETTKLISLNERTDVCADSTVKTEIITIGDIHGDILNFIDNINYYLTHNTGNTKKIFMIYPIKITDGKYDIDDDVNTKGFTFIFADESELESQNDINLQASQYNIKISFIKDEELTDETILKKQNIIAEHLDDIMLKFETINYNEKLYIKISSQTILANLVYYIISKNIEYYSRFETLITLSYVTLTEQTKETKKKEKVKILKKNYKTSNVLKFINEFDDEIKKNILSFMYCRIDDSFNYIRDVLQTRQNYLIFLGDIFETINTIIQNISDKKSFIYNKGKYNTLIEYDDPGFWLPHINHKEANTSQKKYIYKDLVFGKKLNYSKPIEIQTLDEYMPSLFADTDIDKEAAKIDTSAAKKYNQQFYKLHFDKFGNKYIDYKSREYTNATFTYEHFINNYIMMILPNIIYNNLTIVLFINLMKQQKTEQGKINYKILPIVGNHEILSPYKKELYYNLYNLGFFKFNFADSLTIDDYEKEYNKMLKKYFYNDIIITISDKLYYFSHYIYDDKMLYDDRTPDIKKQTVQIYKNIQLLKIIASIRDTSKIITKCNIYNTPGDLFNEYSDKKCIEKITANSTEDLICKKFDNSNPGELPKKYREFYKFDHNDYRWLEQFNEIYIFNGHWFIPNIDINYECGDYTNYPPNYKYTLTIKSNTTGETKKLTMKSIFLDMYTSIFEKSSNVITQDSNAYAVISYDASSTKSLVTYMYILYNKDDSKPPKLTPHIYTRYSNKDVYDYMSDIKSIDKDIRIKENKNEDSYFENITPDGLLIDTITEM